MTSPELKTKPGFDWKHVAWSRPDAARAVLCSYCSLGISEDDVPLMVWRQDGRMAQFCEYCICRWWDMS